MTEQKIDNLGSGRRFVLGQTLSNRLEVDFFNLYAWFLQFVGGKKVLDVACGTGLGSFLIAHKASEVLGVDMSYESIEFAKKNYHLDNLTFVNSNIFDYSLPDGNFDIVILSLVLEQIEHSKQLSLLEKLGKSLKPEGRMLLVTPNKRVTSPSKVVGHEWNKKEFYKTELNQLIKQAGFRVSGWHGQRRVFFLYTNFFVRKSIGLLQILLNTKFGFFGRRESPQVKPINFFWEPKQFNLVLTKE